MRLPFLQVTMELLDQIAPDVALLLNVSKNEAAGALTYMVKWGLGRCPQNEPPSLHDVVPGPHAAQLILNASGLTCDAEELMNACEEVQPALLERVENGVRFRGFDRYDPAWGKNQKPEVWALWRAFLDGTGPDPRNPGTEPARPRPGTARKTKTQTKTQTKEDLSTCPEEDPDLPAPDVPPTGFPQPTAPDASAPRGTPAARTWLVWQSARVDRGMERERHPPDGWESWYLKHAESLGEAKLDAVFERYLDDPWSTDVGPNGRRRDASVRLLMADGDQVLLERLLQLEAEPAPGPAPPKTRLMKILEVPEGLTEEQAMARAREDGDGRHLRPDRGPHGGAS